ncbi:MAG: hypothetical protein LBI82_04620 [Dysgonamonadaceae bacterium]|jgi:hypothetical protein|nr:hypothetical protein [Dysgonamonadaceae bacterium]
MSLINYHKTTTKELLALTNKVRNLITHWGEEGRYKEAILKNIIRRFLPEKYTIGTGFVIKQTNTRGEHLSSKQIDLLIYDDSSPVLFKEGDFVILTPDAVRGIIEVKTNLQNQRLTEILRQANENGEFIFSGKIDKRQPFFNGVFSYEGYERPFNLDTFIQNYNDSNQDFLGKQNYKKFKVNHVALNKDWFIKVWNDDENPHSIYNIEDLAFPFFISNLTDILSNNSVKRNSFIWYATDKELNCVRQF